MEFYAYQECNDAKGQMKAFTIILADKNQENRLSLSKIGTEEGSISCEGYTFPSPYIYRAAIFTQPHVPKVEEEEGKEAKPEQDARITGMRLQSVLGVTDLGGPPDIKAEIVNFDERNQLIGFFGTYSRWYITSLGFLMHDPNCAAYTNDSIGSSNVAASSVSGSASSSDDDSVDVGLIIGPIVGALVLAGGGIGAFFFLRWRKMKKMRQMGADIGQSSKTKVKIMEKNLEVPGSI